MSTIIAPASPRHSASSASPLLFYVLGPSANTSLKGALLGLERFYCLLKQTETTRLQDEEEFLPSLPASDKSDYCLFECATGAAASIPLHQVIAAAELSQAA